MEENITLDVAEQNFNGECPFCNEENFDLAGLKNHFEKGYCEIYNAIDISDMISIFQL